MSSRWFSKTESVVVFCENTLKCKSSAGKQFICYPLISDTVYSLLTKENNISQDVLNKNVITNNNSMSLPGQRLSHHDQPPYSDSNDETYPQESSKDLDRGSVPRNDSTNVQIPPMYRFHPRIQKCLMDKVKLT